MVDEDVVHLVDDGERYELEDEMIVKFMVMGDKEARKELSAKWSQFNAYISDPSIGEVVAFVKDANPYIVTKDVIVLQFPFERQVKKANIKANEKEIAEIFKKMLGKEVFVYSITRGQSVELVTIYQNLRQISQLPKPSEIHIDIKELQK